MISTILHLFGRSPFAPLQSHMEKVSICVHLLRDLFEAIENLDYAAVDTISAKISTIEHQADITKNDIRNHLPKSLFLPIDRNQLLKILSKQDKIADRSEEIAVLVTLKPLKFSPSFISEFKDYLNKNIDIFDKALSIIKEMHDLLEFSFGGVEAEKVKRMVDEVALKEHEIDIAQHLLLKKIYQAENEMS
ncbi:MAG: TIGR00153 family protein, partial [Chryseobacterium sp.]